MGNYLETTHSVVNAGHRRAIAAAASTSTSTSSVKVRRLGIPADAASSHGAISYEVGSSSRKTPLSVSYTSDPLW